jgi:ubiquinol-cytochrome c reductase iron-sulfur subunit
MSDPGAGNGASGSPDDWTQPAGESQHKHRVIGTPPPAQARTLLGDAAGDVTQPEPPELPPGPTDLRRAKKAERLVAALFILSFVASCGFIAAYVGLEVNSVDATLRSNLALGLAMSVAFLSVAVGATIWVRHLMPDVEMSEERHPMASTPAERAAFAKTFRDGADASQFTKRPLLRRTLIAATLPLAAAPLVLLRDMGPLPGTTLRHTVWRKGLRLVTYGANTPIRPADFDAPGQMITVIPEGYQDNPDALAAATAIIIKFQPGVMVFENKSDQVTGGRVTKNWTVDNIVAYSKICTHVGCPAALYDQNTHHILCPCHQSTFDAPRGAQVLFGPAPRPLPQLPLTTDSEGYLVARSDFTEPVGPSFFERG